MASRDRKTFLGATSGANNPVFVQILGICSTLAVTNVVTNTLVMCLGLIFATALSNLTVSVLRKLDPRARPHDGEALIIAALRDRRGHRPARPSCPTSPGSSGPTSG